MTEGSENNDTTTMAVKEPVLVVPRKLTQLAYATLVQNACVSRPWHLQGRYGSRTFAVGDRKGLPLLPGPACRLKKFQNGYKEQNHGDKGPSAFFIDKELQELLLTDGVDIVAMVVPLPKFVEKLQKIADETIHPDRKPSQFSPIKRRKENAVPSTEPAFTFADLFCGIGGFAIALEALGGQCVFASDIDESCREMYLKNVRLSKDLFYGDIYEVPDECFPRNLDFLVGGFPCQPFSTLGHQPGLDDGSRGLLYTQIVRVLQVSQPKAFLLENVPGLVRMEGTLEVIVTALQQAGYNVSVEVCSARSLTAQSRKRLFFVGLRKDDGDDRKEEFQFPYIPDLGLRALDVIEYENEEVDENNHGTREELDLYRVTEAQMEQLLQRSKRWKPSKLAWPDVVLDTLDGHYGVTVGKGNSQLVPCPAPLYPRCFTPRECARLMGFPSWFYIPSQPKEGQGWKAHVKKQFLMFGNSVAPPLIAVLAGSILDQCVDAAGSYRQDWSVLGLEMGIHLSLNSLLPSRHDAVCRRIQAMGLLDGSWL